MQVATRAGRWVLVGTVLGSGIASLDATVVNIALPRLGDDLGADFAGLQWVLNGYTLSLASLILLGGSLGDRFGRRRMFVTGAVWFAVASLLCGLAPTLGFLVAARVLQGIGGALLAPGSLAIIQASFDPADRAKAIGVWSGFGGVATAIGPFVGGWLIGAASWRYLFLLNLPLAAIVVWIALRHVPETRDTSATGRVDLSGAALAALGLGLATYGLIEGSWATGATGLAALGAFLVVEAEVRHPMVPLAMFRARQFSAANGVTFVLYAAISLVLFLVGLVLQQALAYTPLEAGASLIPITLIMLVGSARAGALAQRIGPRLPMSLGPAIVAAGLALMTRIHPGAGYLSTTFPAVVVFACGLALTVAPLTATVLAAADASHAGVASGINNTVARVGGLFAVAAVPLFTAIDPSVPVSPSTLVEGFHTAVAVAAGLALAAGGLAWATIRSDVLATAPDGGAPVEDQEPCFHCGLDGTPLAAYSEAPGTDA